MAKDLNKVMIIGRLGKDPEMRYTPGGSPVTTFSVAAGRQWKDGSGEAREETEWFNVVTWNKLAEICNEHLRKASRVYIEGRIRTRKWQDKDGQERYTTEIEAEEMKMLGSRQGQGEPSYGGDAPAPSYGGAKPAAAAKKPSFDDMDDDIPF